MRQTIHARIRADLPGLSFSQLSGTQVRPRGTWLYPAFTQFEIVSGESSLTTSSNIRICAKYGQCQKQPELNSKARRNLGASNLLFPTPSRLLLKNLNPLHSPPQFGFASWRVVDYNRPNFLNDTPKSCR
jgi:hypothetical protein